MTSLQGSRTDAYELGKGSLNHLRSSFYFGWFRLGFDAFLYSFLYALFPQVSVRKGWRAVVALVGAVRPKNEKPAGGSVFDACTTTSAGTAALRKSLRSVFSPVLLLALALLRAAKV